MNLKDLFNLSNLRSQVAQEQARAHWKFPILFNKIKCPDCECPDLIKRGRNDKGTPRFICRNCRRSFTQPPQFDCTCSVPGQLPKCSDCPHFNEFLLDWKQKTQGLEGKSFEELECLLRQEQSKTQYRELCRQVAMREALLNWPVLKPPQKVECPRCQSTQVRKRGWDNGKRRYGCRQCGRSFSIQPPFECNCSIPGQLPRCSDCPHFQIFSEQLERRTRDLLLLSREEVEQKNAEHPEKS